MFEKIDEKEVGKGPTVTGLNKLSGTNTLAYLSLVKIKSFVTLLTPGDRLRLELERVVETKKRWPV